MTKNLTSFLVSVFILSLTTLAYCQCETTIDGNCYLDVDVIDYDGIDSVSVSDSDTARMYYDLSEQKLKCSEDGSSYVDCISSLGSSVDISSETNLTATSPIILTNDDLSLGTVDISGKTNLSATSPIVLTGDTLSLSDVALGSQTSGNYVANASTNVLTGLTGGSAGSEGASLSLAFDYTATLAANPALSASNCVFATTGLICEGSTANTFETLLTFTDPTADRTITFPNQTGTVCTTGSVCTGYAASTSDITAVGDVASGAAFNGTQGTTLTFNDTVDQTLSYDTTNDKFVFSDNLSIGSAGVDFSTSNGILTMTGLGTGADENLVIDFDSSTNNVRISSSSGVTDVGFTSIDLTVGGSDLTLGSSVSGVRISDDADGAVTFLGLSSGNDESLTMNLDDGTANHINFYSSSSANRLNFGNDGVGLISNIYFGCGAEDCRTDISGTPSVLSAGSVAGATDVTGQHLYLYAGKSTGADEATDIVLWTTDSTTSGTTQQTLRERMRVEGDETHIAFLGDSPSLSGCGDGATITGNDTAGRVHTGDGIGGPCCTLIRADQAETSTMWCVATIVDENKYYVHIASESDTQFDVCIDAGIGDISNRRFNYHCFIGNNP